MINEMLLEHEAPSLDDVQKSLFERFPVNPEPTVKHFHWIDLLTFLIDLLICVNLKAKQNCLIKKNPKKQTDKF
jgi:hypothetical protein